MSALHIASSCPHRSINRHSDNSLPNTNTITDRRAVVIERNRRTIDRDRAPISQERSSTTVFDDSAPIKLLPNCKVAAHLLRINPPDLASSSTSCSASPSPKSITSLSLCMVSGDPQCESETESDSKTAYKNSDNCMAYGPYANQVGGHGDILQGRPGRIVKPSNVKERLFYETLESRSERQLEPLVDLIFTPMYYGSVNELIFVSDEEAEDGSSEGNNGRQDNRWIVQDFKMKKNLSSSATLPTWIELEDINHGVQYPCIMDVKIGTRHFDDDASAAKRAKSIRDARSTTSLCTGLRIVASQVVRDDGTVKHHGKKHGKSLRPCELLGEFEWFFRYSDHSDENSKSRRGTSERIRVDVVKSVIAQVQQLLDVMRSIDAWNFYSTSLLFVYDAKSDAKIDGVVMDEDKDEDERKSTEEESNKSNKSNKAYVKMIDFAHAVQCKAQTRREDGYVFGLSNLVSLLTAMVDRHEAREMRKISI